MSNSIEGKIRRAYRRIKRLESYAERAYSRQHNIIAVNYLNKVMVIEQMIAKWESMAAQGIKTLRQGV